MDPITISQFRSDYPMFTNTTSYPDSLIQRLINRATSLMNASVWGNDYQDFMELFVAHYCTLWNSAMIAAQNGGDPGIARGVIASESALGVAAAFDTVSAAEESGGNYNLTQWGQQFIRMARLKGMGPQQINIGPPGPTLGAWCGPISTLTGNSN